jgi:hypothetical protein
MNPLDIGTIIASGKTVDREMAMQIFGNDEFAFAPPLPFGRY